MQKALEIIKEFEGCVLNAYEPPEGVKNGYAIGYGYTRPWVTKDCVISQEWAEQLLIEIVKPLYKKINARTDFKLNDEQLSALTSFTYNVGYEPFKESTLLREIKAGNFIKASREFHRWVYVGKERLPGLVRRRHAEANLFEGKPWK